jgi:hypothetical protein
MPDPSTLKKRLTRGEWALRYVLRYLAHIGVAAACFWVAKQNVPAGISFAVFCILRERDE